MIVELSACFFHVTNGVERRNEHNGEHITNVQKISAEKSGRITGASMGGCLIGNNLTDFSFPQKIPYQAWILCLNY